MDVFNVGGFLSFGSPAAESEETSVVSPTVQVKKTQSVQSSMVEKSSTIVTDTPQQDGTLKAYHSRLDRMKKDETPQTGFASVLNWAVLGSPQDVTPSPAPRKSSTTTVLQFPEMSAVSGLKTSGSSGSMANLVPVSPANNSYSPVPVPLQKEITAQSLISPPAVPTLTTPTASVPSSTNEANELRYQLEIHDLRRQLGLSQAARTAAEDALRDFQVQVEESNAAKVAAEQQVAELQQQMTDNQAKCTLEYTELEGQLAQVHLDLTATQKDVEGKAGQITELTSTVADLSPKLAMSTSLMDQLSQANATLEKQMEEVTTGLTSCQNDRTEAMTLLTDSSRKLNLAMVQIEQMNEKNNAMQDLLDDARLDLSKCQQDKATADRKLEDMRKAVTEREGWINDKDKVISQLEEMLVDVEKTQTGLASDLLQQTTCSEALRNQLEQACEDVKEQQQNIAERNEIINELRTFVAAGEKVVVIMEFP